MMLIAGWGGWRVRTEGADVATYTIDIPNYHPPLLNALLGANRYQRSRLNRECDEMVSAYATMAGVPSAVGMRLVSLRLEGWARGRTCDPDAPWKSLLDALVSARLLVDDSPVYCLPGKAEIVRAPQRRTVITLEDL